ncbi:DNA polymerase Y family protein [Ideonella azotifigens]|uniref:DNA polymerase Y family protein n=1 Tax=Ideonella azotifigens TaxID=513160 RepID=A0ABN1JWH1_9BURK|nr:DNA polymerase Y family protein [Ideonella azotifigens]MCD2341190.1 DNA polymerase Y family protein [Ideonella azotifigens]
MRMSMLWAALLLPPPQAFEANEPGGGEALAPTPPLLSLPRGLAPSRSREPVGTPIPAEEQLRRQAEALQGLAQWALQFTPRVALADGEAVLMEVAGSLRLFGGQRALRLRVRAGAREMGAQAVGWAGTGLAALALARAGVQQTTAQPLAERLDPLPVATLSALRPHALTLAQIGCPRLGDVRRLPRSGLARRFDAAMLQALDQAYGVQPEVHAWQALPASFRARIELMQRVDQAPALMGGARRLLLQLCGWLAARHLGVSACTLHWSHDSMRARDVEAHGELQLRTAQPTRDPNHLTRLLAEHLQHLTLAAPVSDLALSVQTLAPIAPPSGSLLPDAVQQAEALTPVLERLAARLGEERVSRPLLREDHRPECTQQWVSAVAPLPRGRARISPLPQPAWLLAAPLPLAMHHNKPTYQGPLLLLMGPNRVDAGWWDRTGQGDAAHTRQARRDYWVAWSDRAGLLWLFQTRQQGEFNWFLHGFF